MQGWIWPHTKGLTSRYAEKAFPTHSKRQLIASPDERHGSLLINQNATLERLQLTSGEQETLFISAGRTGMLHVISGSVATEKIALGAGDAVRKEGDGELPLTVTAATEMLWFDLP